MKSTELAKDLPNIGPVLAQELANVGIVTTEDLKKVGSAGALFRIRSTSADGCINMLYALEGAIKGIRWHDLTAEEKAQAKKALEDLLKETTDP
jgi:DNA transformation protein